MSDDISDDELWKSAVRDVKKLKTKSRKEIVPSPSFTNKPDQRKDISIYDLHITRKQELSYLTPGDMSGLDKRLAQSIKQGKYMIDYTLDLHGRNRHQAYISLQQCLLNAYQQGKRCILVITGKGEKQGSFRYDGVIRDLLPEWINLESLRPVVIAYCYAAPHHGGVGAMYIYIKRRR